jgi:catechol 2,3-dioxygenase-like lactoylglutathione lyase family enzyme
MHVTGLDHINIRTTDLKRLRRFYTEILDLEVGERPSSSSRGLWLYASGKPIVHVNLSDKPASGDTLPLHHVAFAATGFKAITTRLSEAGFDFEVFDVPGRDIRQVFVDDPDGVSVELNFTQASDLVD